MGPPSQLAIATSVLTRLVKEEASYHRELSQQHASIAKLERDGGDENVEFTLRQERKAVEETKALFPQLKVKIEDALARLEQLLQKAGSTPSDQATALEDTAKAQVAVVAAKAAIAEIS